MGDWFKVGTQEAPIVSCWSVWVWSLGVMSVLAVQSSMVSVGSLLLGGWLKVGTHEAPMVLGWSVWVWSFVFVSIAFMFHKQSFTVVMFERLNCGSSL